MKSSLPDEQRAQPVPPDLKEVWARAGPRLGPFADRLHCLSTIPSTNDLALRLADAGAKEGTTLLAEAQTAGRGRRGREWFSPPGSGIYVSVILRPSFTPPSFDDPVTKLRLNPPSNEPASQDGEPSLLGGRSAAAAKTASKAEGTKTSFIRDDIGFGRCLEAEHRVRAPITLAAGVALAEGVRASTGLPVELKWPNDLVCERRKLAGILAEMGTTGSDGSEAVVLGIGINVRAAAYPPELAATATSLEAELGRPIDRALVLVETLAALASRYADLQAGRFDAILTAWRGLARSLPGAPVEWDGPAGVVRGLAIDIDSDGTLLARTESGIARLVAGEVRWR